MKTLIQISSILALLIVFAGCGDPKTETESSNAPPVKGELPKLRFHKPKEFGLAIKRLQEAHEVLMSEDPIPAPIQFKILEVVHGTGSSAHSHYYLADGEIEEDEHEEPVVTTEFLHDLEIDLFTEINDISKWLPIIAGDTSLSETDWNQVKNQSEALVDHLFGTQNDALSDDEKRAAYQKEAAKIKPILDTLSELSSKLPPGDDESDA